MGISLKDNNNNEIIIINKNKKPKLINNELIVKNRCFNNIKLANMYASNFEIQGNSIVECKPISNTPINLKLSFLYTQNGTGDPSSTNIREIIGVQQIKIIQTNNIDEKNFILNFPNEIYGGDIDFSTGLFKKTWEIINSYNNEELPGQWISDRDIYSNESIPSIGAKVVYKLSTPIIQQFQKIYINGMTNINFFSSNYSNCNITISGLTSIGNILKDLQEE